PDRSCGACTACCTVPNIKTLGKPSGCDCEHLTPGGCGIYPDRPEACREYHCLWRMGWGRPEDRPDRSGVLLEFGENVTPWDKQFNLRVFELRPGAIVRRFPFGEAPEFLRLIGRGDGSWVVALVPHGVPRACGMTPADRYRDHLPPGGPESQDYYIGDRVITLQVGVIDPEGNLHTGRDFVPAA